MKHEIVLLVYHAMLGYRWVVGTQYRMLILRVYCVNSFPVLMLALNQCLKMLVVTAQ